jgi:hypothetical protein
LFPAAAVAADQQVQAGPHLPVEQAVAPQVESELDAAVHLWQVVVRRVPAGQQDTTVADVDMAER